eukprot:TRINITY_DN5082_c0_g1_i1.p1 TRINITY_DN5082_c0_g1~~TRINITY_DN5082_c0_g1_i1.p1  ORF type:complete len:1107 (-),score=186.33 TRINITY_DN5082_c0_g1_i1:147-3467(-)
MRRKVFVILSMLAFIIYVWGEQGGTEKLKNPESECNLACWLKHFTLVLPNISISYAPIGFNASLNDMECREITLENLDSSLGLPDTLFLTPKGIGLTCFGDWALNFTTDDEIDLHWEGTLRVTVGSSDGSAEVSLTKDEDTGLVSNASLPSCRLNIVVPPHAIIIDNGTDPIPEYLLDPLLSLIARELEPLIDSIACYQMQQAVSKNVTQHLQQINAVILPFLKPLPPYPAPPLPQNQTYYKWTENDFVEFTSYLLSEFIGSDGPLGVNKIANQNSNGTGWFSVSDVSAWISSMPFLKPYNISFPISIPVLDDGFVDLSVLSFNVTGLNTWRDISILTPASTVNDYSIQSFTDLERLTINVSFSLNVTSKFDTHWLYEEFYIYTNLSDLTFNSTFQIALQTFENPDFNSKFKGFMDFNMELLKNCFLENIYDFNLTQFSFNMSTNEITINPIPGDKDTIESRFDKFLSNTFYYFTENYRPAVTGFFNAFLAEKLRLTVNEKVKGLLNETRGQCPIGSSGYDVPSPTGYAGWGGGLNYTSFYWCSFGFVMWIVFLTVTILGVWYYKKRHPHNSPSFLIAESTTEDETVAVTEEGIVWRKADEDDDSNRHSSSDKSALLPGGRGEENKPIKGKGDDKSSIFLTSRLPIWVRLIIPTLVGLNIAIFVLSNTSVGGSVHVRASGATSSDSHVDSPSMFSFSLSNTIRDMWRAKVYPLSLLIATFSGFWPYAKLLLMLICIFVPTRLLSASVRETLLRMLDALGKWSLIDSWVMVLMLIAFSLKVRIPPDTEAPGMMFRVYVEPQIGFYTFLLGTMSSLALTHVVVAIHRHVNNSLLPVPSKPQITDKSISGRKTNKKQNKKKYRALVIAAEGKYLRWLVPPLLIISFVTLILGLLADSFRFEFKGAAGWGLGVLSSPDSSPPVSSYNIIDIAGSIPAASVTPNALGIRLIQFTFIVFVICVPIIHIIGLMIVFLTPLTFTVQKRLFIILEVLNAWSGLDVFVVGIIAAILEVQQFAGFIVGSKCDKVNPILDSLMGRELVESGAGEVCFGVKADLNKGCWLLFAAALLELGVSIFVMRTCHRALNRREESGAKTSSSSEENTQTADAIND